MSTDVALSDLRRLWEYHHKKDLALVPNQLCHPDGLCEDVWQVIDALVYATVVFDGGYEEAVIATGATAAEAIEKAGLELNKSRANK